MSAVRCPRGSIPLWGSVIPGNTGKPKRDVLKVDPTLDPGEAMAFVFDPRHHHPTSTREFDTAVWHNAILRGRSGEDFDDEPYLTPYVVPGSDICVLLAAGGVALFALRRINKYALTALLGAVMLLDLVPVDLRFLSHDDFISARRRQITATAADKAILTDKDPGFRVLNLTVSPFQDATTSYFHRSVGGYHGAKLARYQDLIDRYLSYRNDAVLDMLNTRYLIVPGDDGQPQAVRRATANGPAWFVEGIVAADTPQQEIDLLGSVDLKTTAVAAPADKAFAEEWQAGGQADTTLVRGIALTEYRPNYQKYEYTAPEESVAVFSEIFYDHGWTAYVDGEAMPGFRADYILRAMKLPAGRHTVEWRFRAPGWAAAEAVTLVSSLLILLGGAAALIYCFRKKKA